MKPEVKTGLPATNKELAAWIAGSFKVEATLTGYPDHKVWMRVLYTLLKEHKYMCQHLAGFFPWRDHLLPQEAPFVEHFSPKPNMQQRRVMILFTFYLEDNDHFGRSSVCVTDKGEVVRVTCYSSRSEVANPNAPKHKGFTGFFGGRGNVYYRFEELNIRTFSRLLREHPEGIASILYRVRDAINETVRRMDERMTKLQSFNYVVAGILAVTKLQEPKDYI